MNLKTKTIRSVALLALCLGSGCTVCRYYGEVQGVLLSSPEGRPIPGAAVVGVYAVEHGTVGGQVDEPVDARETTTDAQGRFVLSGKFVIAPRLPLSGFAARPWIFTCAPGYEAVCLQREQTYSRVDTKDIPLGTNTLGLSIYRTEARPLLTVITNQQTHILEFRVSPLANDVNTYFVRGPTNKIPNYLKLFNAERRKHGLPEWTGKM